jgi:hypothetical protein
MPLEDSTAASRLDERYCIHCQNQSTGELGSYQQVREGSIRAAVRILGKTQAEAEKMAEEMLPQLPRWRCG